MTAEALDGGYVVETVEALDGRYTPIPWPFAIDHAPAIDRHWAEAVARQPRLFNGRVLMMTEVAVIAAPDGTRRLTAAYADVDFKAFLAWRDFGHPMRGFRNGFGAAALQAADGAFVLGEMAPHTANAGRVYFPSGTPDLGDIRDGAVDIAGSIARELGEETGLDPAALDIAPDFTVLHDAVRVCIMQRVRSRLPAEELVARIEAALARETLPELARLHVVRSAADITPAMPSFVALYLRRALGASQPG